MKGIECAALAVFNSYIRSVKINDTKVSGAMELFSSKVDAQDRKLSRELEQKYVDELAASPFELARSPIGDMSDARIRKTLIRLITTLNASFPDYDFSSLKPEDFLREGNLGMVSNSINLTLSEVADHYGDVFLNSLWNTLRQTISPEECEVYSYIPDFDSDPQCEGKLWGFNYFFYNKRTSKILFFYCTGARLSTRLDDDSDSSSNAEFLDLDDMSDEGM